MPPSSISLSRTKDKHFLECYFYSCFGNFRHRSSVAMRTIRYEINLKFDCYDIYLLRAGHFFLGTGGGCDQYILPSRVCLQMVSRNMDTATSFEWTLLIVDVYQRNQRVYSLCLPLLFPFALDSRYNSTNKKYFYNKTKSSVY